MDCHRSNTVISCREGVIQISSKSVPVPIPAGPTKYLEVLDRNAPPPILWGETLDHDKFEVWDWDKAMAEHKKKLEKEIEDRTSRQKESEKKESHYHLQRLCKTILEENEKNWIARRKEREIETKKKERLEIARGRKNEIMHKMLERKLENERKKLPIAMLEEIEKEEKKVRRMEIQEVKNSLWKLRTKKKTL